jgi:hypothetical protein
VNKRCAKSGYDEECSKNLRIPVLTLGAFVLPLRDVPGVVNSDSASESSDTSSEHHCTGKNRAEQKESGDDDDTAERSMDNMMKAQIRVPEIRAQDARTKDELRLCLCVPSELSPQRKTPPVDPRLRTPACPFLLPFSRPSWKSSTGR